MSNVPPKAGVPVQLEDGLSCVLAPNPSPMTYWGTNTYLLGTDSLAVIDPGPLDDDHLRALIAAIDGRPVSHILVTHSHLDHSPLARTLSDLTSAPILAFGDSSAGRSEVMLALAASGEMGGGEGVDHDFKPDILLSDGEVIDGGDWHITARHTPGHFGNHLSFLWGNAAFTGDHMMGWASSLVSPPDGDLTDFMASCAALSKTAMSRAYSAHGAPILDAQSRLADLVAHRLGREAEILAALRKGPATPAELTNRIYKDIANPLIPMAQRNVLAHLVDLTQRHKASSMGPLSATAQFVLT
ncbi:MBL fold metallo-hydrolase [Octadecabacter ascidiaceicola]|uniref:Hydroxyacylglutathione hydrolase n=1 Tax=Octadecabacter ascidiaceicola TaxID=1655543 RepID=A0A238JMB2_9RHOB|nr:MBL fold metallo-hydrolase [Octadecabacter ascidiaceicola]SMX31809.1 Hydroxyacylglutathione hydrolase [Octadecabacter ascidiaceicola]